MMLFVKKVPQFRVLMVTLLIQLTTIKKYLLRAY